MTDGQIDEDGWLDLMGLIGQVMNGRPELQINMIRTFLDPQDRDIAGERIAHFITDIAWALESVRKDSDE